MSHTPGPWKFYRSWLTGDNDRVTILELDVGMMDLGYSEENAGIPNLDNPDDGPLIEHAPDLLAALKHAVREGDASEWMDEALVAIAAAEGRES